LAGLGPDFHALHRSTYGHAAPAEAVELVTLRLSGFGGLDRPSPAPARVGSRAPVAEARAGSRPLLLPGSRRRRNVPLIRRELLRARNVIPGPAIVEEMDSTTVILPGQAARVDGHGNLWIEEE